MKDEEVLAFIPIFITGFALGVGLTMIFCLFKFHDIEKENSELKNENHKLEQKLLKLYEEQAEHTKRKAESNGVGGIN